METKINIVEILKDKPQGTKLYSSACGECKLEEVDDKSFKISFYNSKFGFMNGGEGYLGKNGKVYMANNSPLLANYGYDYISISVRKGTKVHNILEKLMPLKGVKRSYGAEVCYRVPKSEFEKEEL